MASATTTLEAHKAAIKRHPVRHVAPTIAQLKTWTQARYGKDPILFECLDLLWTMESHWNYASRGAKTREGRAYGIPQALPASKMKLTGADYLTNPYTQIKWGLRYIELRYNNNACWALRHELNKGWY